MAHHLGKVAWFNNAKGYGFLLPARVASVFCQFSSIRIGGFRNLSEAKALASGVEHGDKQPEPAKLIRAKRTKSNS